MSATYSPRTGKKEGEEQHWQVLQKRTFTRYMNSKLKCRGIVVNDLYEDLKSGVVLYNFLEVLTGESLKRFGKLNNGKMRIQQVANQNVVFSFFPEADIKLENIGVMDVVDGTPTPVLGLIWSIIAFYLVRELGDSGDDLAAVKKKILRWCKKHAGNKVPVHNLTDSFADGKAFLAILNDIDNAGSPYRPDEDDPCKNFKTAFEDAEDKYNLPQMLDPDDENLWRDEISMLTYLATMMDTLPDSVAQPDPAKLIDEWLDDHADELEDDLSRLCACESVRENPKGKEDARRVVDDVMRKTEMDPSKSTKNQAVAEWIVDPQLPTVLLYATTLVDSGKDPTLFSPRKEGDRFVGAGVQNDKANVIAPLYAARALKKVLDGGPTTPLPPCNFVVVAGDGDVESLPTHIKADYVLVSEPKKTSLGAVSPQAENAALYGCRGILEMTVACSRAGPSAPLHADATVGPFVDPVVALASKLAALRDKSDAAPASNNTVAGLPSLSLDFVDYVQGGPDVSKEDVVSAAKASVDYVDSAITAPEFAASKPPLAALALDPSLVVQKFWTSSEGQAEGGVVAVPTRALATIRCGLPPGYNDFEGAAAKVEEAMSHDGYGYELERVGKVVGKPGYLSDSRQPMSKLITEVLGDEKGKEVALGADPNYSAVASAFATKIPNAAVFQVLGLPRSEDQDSVDMPRVIQWTKQLAKLINSAMVPKNPPKLKPYDTYAIEAAPVATDTKAIRPSSIVALPSSPKLVAAPAPKPPPPPKAAVAPPPPTPPKVVAPPPAAPPKVVTPPSPPPVEVAPPPPPPPSPPTPSPPLEEKKAPREEEPTNHRDEMVASETLPEEESPPPQNEPMGPSIPTVEGEGVSVTAESIVAELNKLREDPGTFVDVLKGMLPLYREDKSFWPSEPDAQPFMTHEGKAATEEAIAYLEGIKTAPGEGLRPLKLHEGMSLAAAEHADDLVRSGERLGHKGSDGSKPADRLSRHGRWFERASECLAYRHLSAPALVAHMVVDDGMPSRTQRNTTLSPEMRAVGAAVRQHPSHGILAVITFAGGYGPHPLETCVVVESDQFPPPPKFKEVLDSVPVIAVHEQVESSLSRGEKVELDYKPGALKMTICTPDGAGQMYGVEWEV